MRRAIAEAEQARLERVAWVDSLPSRRFQDIVRRTLERAWEWNLVTAQSEPELRKAIERCLVQGHWSRDTNGRLITHSLLVRATLQIG